MHRPNIHPKRSADRARLLWPSNVHCTLLRTSDDLLSFLKTTEHDRRRRGSKRATLDPAFLLAQHVTRASHLATPTIVLGHSTLITPIRQEDDAATSSLQAIDFGFGVLDRYCRSYAGRLNYSCISPRLLFSVCYRRFTPSRALR